LIRPGRRHILAMCVAAIEWRIRMSSVLEMAKSCTLAYNEKNWGKVEHMLAADAVYDEIGTHRHIRGTGKIIEAWKGWASAIPDSRATFVRELASGDTAVLEMIWKGVHSGPLPTPAGVVAASNKPVELPACQIVSVRDGKVVSIAHYFDFLTLLRQVGAA
jgi:steroid delta-isomerase-like uncharacterized protein